MKKFLIIAIIGVALWLFLKKNNTGVDASIFTGNGDSNTNGNNSDGGGGDGGSNGGGGNSDISEITPAGAALQPSNAAIELLSTTEKSTAVAAIFNAARENNMDNPIIVYNEAVKVGARPLDAAVAASQVGAILAVEASQIFPPRGGTPPFNTGVDPYVAMMSAQARAVTLAERAVS